MPKASTQMPDVNGRPLHIGDIVVSTLGGRPKLYRSRVAGFTPKKIRLKLMQDVQGKELQYGTGEIITRFSDEVSLVESPYSSVV